MTEEQKKILAEIYAIEAEIRELEKKIHANDKRDLIYDMDDAKHELGRRNR